MSIVYWIFFYAAPAGIAVYINSKQKNQRNRIITMHGFVALSIFLLSIEGVRLMWNTQLPYMLAAIAALLVSSYLLGLGGLAYAVSSTIQESCLLLAAALLMPVLGILPSAIATALVYTLAHRTHPTESEKWRWKFPIIFFWGVASVLLYVGFHQPLLNIALHASAGAVLIYWGLLYPKYDPTKS